jgi:hypothetical protein
LLEKHLKGMQSQSGAEQIKPGVTNLDCRLTAQLIGSGNFIYEEVKPKMLIQEVSAQEMVKDLVDKFTGMWWESSTAFPLIEATYSLREQIEREKELSIFLDELYRMMRQTQASRVAGPEIQERLQSLTASVIKTSLGLGDHHIQAILDYGFRDAVVEFFQLARQFDPQVRDEDIYQAIRNSTSMHLMQVLLGLPVEVTPAVFAFSMLYPYTDNYLDDPSISTGIKTAFNRRFRQRLEGDDLSPANSHESTIFALVELIEGQYSRSGYPHLFESLLAIHAAQVKSLELVGELVSPYQVDVLRTCMEKGGSSALADGYLVAGALDPQQRDFVFFYGAFTQLMDDLEDVHSDLENQIMTVFSVTAQRWPLDGVTSRTFHFGRYLFDVLGIFDSPGLAPLKEMLSIVYYPILIDSSSVSSRFYTRPYLKQLQAHYPLRFSYLRKQRIRFRRRRQSLKLLLESLAMYALSQPGNG